MKFKFKVQQYQTDAADAVASVFEGQPNQGASAYLRDLGTAKRHWGMESGFAFSQGAEEGYANAPVALNRDDIFTNVRAVQRRNQIPESEELFCGMGACQLDVEMETGTGKTYVYTKTMLELNRLYGWCKFIVVVPSVAIREGVAKSLENTQEHFFAQYHKKIRFFIYDSDNLTELDAYSQSSDVNCMVINMQAFNASMKEGAKNKAARIIFDERDEFGSRRPIDVIAANRPIVICDEPQKMGKKGGATQKGIARFNPLFVLNCSATHKEKHDLVYALDALDAYNQKLVKRIEVKGFALKNMRGTDGYLYLRDIVVSKNRAPEAVIEFHTDLRQWFLNDGFKETKVSLGQFPISREAYELLKKASAHVDWIVLAFCPLFGEEVRDAAIVRCCNGMFETSADRQGVIQTPYLGLGKEAPFRKQGRQGDVEFDVSEHAVSYLVENTSEQMDGIELFNSAISGAAEAFNLARKEKPFAATTSVQLAYDIIKDSLKHKNVDIEPQDVLKAIREMNPSEKSARMENWRKRWLTDSV